ncbi:ras-related protein Rab-8A-like [Stylophora pistillata]|uniref:ras-related protein Rab-8A-like n=1 Tax=Stylophora pistillata TaxID=50429 RepID=UPI000C0420F9|nr:ras-related protein Rab-8A-like [Stylophora pistillata]
MINVWGYMVLLSIWLKNHMNMRLTYSWWAILVLERRSLRSCFPQVYPMGIMLLYDITKYSSFDNVPFWMRLIKEHAPPDVDVLLMGSKCHNEDGRAVPTEVAAKEVLVQKILKQ